MNTDPVEGVHYIFDRYAFINQILTDGKKELRISEESGEAELKQAFGIARAMYHPDRQARSGEEFRKKAEEKTRLIADAEAFLLKPELKVFYDQKLAEFRENKPHLVSDSGVAIISLGETFFDIGSLLSDNVADTSEFEARVKAMLQYDEKRLPQFKSLYAAMPDNAQIKSLYRDALTQELVYLTLLEDSAWAKVGYINRKEKEEGLLLRPSDYSKRLEATIQKSAERDIDSTIDKHAAVARIGMAKTPLALEAVPGTEAPGGELVDPETRRQRLIATFKEVAHKNFELRADYVREVGARKQAVLEDLVALAPVETLGAEQPGQTVFDFYLAQPAEDDGSQKVVFRLELDITTGNAGIGETYAPGTTLADLKTQGIGRLGFAVTRNPEISDLMLEIASVSEKFLNERQKDAPAAPEKAAPKTKPPTP